MKRTDGSVEEMGVEKGPRYEGMDRFIQSEVMDTALEALHP